MEYSAFFGCYLVSPEIAAFVLLLLGSITVGLITVCIRLSNSRRLVADLYAGIRWHDEHYHR